MKIIYENIEKIYEDKESHDYGLLKALLDDLHMYNETYFPQKMEIHYEDNHTEYSPERTDPCPDYYGTFSVKWEGCSETIVDGLSLHELDEHMCTLCACFEQLKEYFN